MDYLLLNWKFYLMVFIMLSGNVILISSQEIESVCEDELQLLLNEYNDLTEDYHSGTNCGTVRYLLIDNNHKLSDSLKICNQDLGESKVYKNGFYFLFIVNILLIFYYLVILIINLWRKK